MLPHGRSDRAPAEEKAEVDVHLAHRLKEPAVAQRAGIDRLEVHGRDQILDGLLGRGVITGQTAKKQAEVINPDASALPRLLIRRVFLHEG